MCLAGVAPSTRQSGKMRTVGFRWSCDKHLRDAVLATAVQALPPPPKSPGHRSRVRPLPAGARPGDGGPAKPAAFPTRRHRPTPFLWSQRDIYRLLHSARALRPTLRAATHEALFGLLVTCGMRVGEALGLDRDDVDLEAGVITIATPSSAAPGWSRCIPRSQRPWRATPRSRPPLPDPPRQGVLRHHRGHHAPPQRRGQDLQPAHHLVGMRTENVHPGHMTSGTALPSTR